LFSFVLSSSIHGPSQIPGNGDILVSNLTTTGQVPITPNSPPAIGSVTANFNGAVVTYDDLQILEMILFYNDDFGIRLEDSLGTGMLKFREFLIF
jgi:hypothetical protein